MPPTCAIAILVAFSIWIPLPAVACIRLTLLTPHHPGAEDEPFTVHKNTRLMFCFRVAAAPWKRRCGECGERLRALFPGLQHPSVSAATRFLFSSRLSWTCLAEMALFSATNQPQWISQTGSLIAVTVC
ncbi:hypothetical protein BDW02DRAFT_54008 [Decorospora gaudefroyi]|uniref:Secreted protein n=1 Tax=Decorospora gaudefroyi TaxID=184978 RepID=A0A6A5KQ76_9PLEO|nr:hypothetical protein BDW02DRAFT_54008 [Decorospora gaudefroyi]